MLTTFNQPPMGHWKLRPKVMRKVPVTVHPTADEKQQLHHDRMAALAAVLFVVALIAFVIWAAARGESPPPEFWEHPWL